MKRGVPSQSLLCRQCCFKKVLHELCYVSIKTSPIVIFLFLKCTENSISAFLTWRVQWARNAVQAVLFAVPVGLHPA